jgi:hypothetical protein
LRIPQWIDLCLFLVFHGHRGVRLILDRVAFGGLPGFLPERSGGVTGIVEGMLNSRAIRKYGEFIGAMDMVEEAFRAVDSVIERVDDSAVAAGGWTLPTQDDLKSLRRTAFNALDAVRVKAKKHEGDLVSREWAV